MTASAPFEVSKLQVSVQRKDSKRAGWLGMLGQSQVHHVATLGQSQVHQVMLGQSQVYQEMLGQSQVHQVMLGQSQVHQIARQGQSQVHQVAGPPDGEAREKRGGVGIGRLGGRREGEERG